MRPAQPSVEVRAVEVRARVWLFDFRKRAAVRDIAICSRWVPLFGRHDVWRRLCSPPIE